jgi:L-threonylcarbamoyladenylate synthase
MMLKIDPLHPNRNLLKQADECLANGGLVVFPTETVYGLAADPAVAGAEQRIYQAKGRPSDKPVARFIRTLEALPRDGVTLIPEIERLAARFWPGPLTLVLQAGEQWIGYRMHWLWPCWTR